MLREKKELRPVKWRITHGNKLELALLILTCIIGKYDEIQL